ncbi:hypothetical protein M231_06612 [Tremella mesenterica]|uniref:Uncharacterized protein n=1 Tax=Tremella mesenterica TaxID=5217 RepID=A0A4Q1BG45_TREME|nr:hypothetical protein M231_06612 [Tremella mesenterica]
MSERTYNTWTVSATSSAEYSRETSTLTLKAAWSLSATGITNDYSKSQTTQELFEARKGLQQLRDLADQTAGSLLSNRLISDKDFEGTKHHWKQQVELDFILEFSQDDTSALQTNYEEDDESLVLLRQPTDQDETLDDGEIQTEIDYYNDDDEQE